MLKIINIIISMVRTLVFSPYLILGFYGMKWWASRRRKNGTADVFTNVCKFRSHHQITEKWFLNHFSVKKEAVALESDQGPLAIIHGGADGTMYDRSSGQHPVRDIFSIFPEVKEDGKVVPYKLISCYNGCRQEIENFWTTSDGREYYLEIPEKTKAPYSVLLMPFKEKDGSTSLVCFADKWVELYVLVGYGLIENFSALAYAKQLLKH